MRKRCLLLLTVAVFACAQPVPPALFDQLRWRLIGPFRGGRVVAVTGVPGDPASFYFGSVGGGVWKTTDAGTVWKPVFDQQRVASIGAIAVAPSAPDTLYVGTGETDIRSQIGFGDGVYKSTDAGRTWHNIGLRDTTTIAKILVDPQNPDRVFVASLGHVYGPNPERGVFRSTDGGRTWQKVLYSRPDTGAVDLAWDPANVKVIYATMWNAHRPPWSQYGPIEGPGSGLWKSSDGGDHWTEIKGHGLPESGWRRSGVAVASGGRRVYLVLDAQRGGGVFRSDDAGVNWTRTSGDTRLTSRAWYFSGITVDPKDSNRVYVPNVSLLHSNDGGRNFTVLKGAPGGDDYHILWIDPAESRRMILGSDQGTNVSFDGGATWSTWYNQPTAQMYHVTTDNRFPYAVYGAQQDSGTAGVMSRADHGQIDARDWFSVGGGEAGYIAIDPKDNDVLFVGDTAGSLSRFDRRSGQGHDVTPWPLRSRGENPTHKYRFPWTPALLFSPADPSTLFFGSQYLLKTTDGGITWKEISPDLTGDTRKVKTAAGPTPTPENARALGYGVIYAIGPSPLNAATIWVGSDTGLLHVTRDGGATWQDVTPKGLPDWSRVTQIEASHFDPAVAYATVDRHRMEDYKPYIYRTRDYGKTWDLVTAGLAAPAYVNGLREDPARKGLLYAATELGAAISFDYGGHWQSLQLNLPAVSVRDLVIHGDDLVIATHGRGFWILDDVSPLRQIDESATTTQTLLYQPADAIRTNPETFFGTPIPVEEPKAKNPPAGAMLDFYFKAAPAGEVAIEILDSRDQVVRRFSSSDRVPKAPARPQQVADVWIEEAPRLTTRAGMNRLVWDLRYAAPAGGGDEYGPPPRGPLVMPGTYQVRLTVGGQTHSKPLVVKLDPRSNAGAEDLQKQFDLSIACWRDMSRANSAGLRDVSRQLAAALAAAQSADRTPPAAAYTLYEQAHAALEKR